MRRILPLALLAAALAFAPRATARLGARAQQFSSTIQGNVLTSTNGQLANTVVRLRDARFGRIVDSQTTDKSGLFAFRSVDPGSYIVEVMGPDQESVLAASRILNVDAGDVVSAVVRLPLRPASTATPLATAAIVTAAAVNRVLAVVPPAGAVPSCPVQ